MNRPVGEPAGLAPRLAAILSGGTLTSCALITAGMAMPLLGDARAALGGMLVSCGVVLLLLLPPLRVLITATWFLRRHDYPAALVALLVLAIIVAATTLGLEAR